MAKATNNNEERRIDRLDEFIAASKLNDNIVTKQSGIAVGTIGKSRKADKDLSQRTCIAILDAFPQLSRSWLLTGEGDMLTEDNKPTFPAYPLLDSIKADCGKAFGTTLSMRFDELPRISLPGIPADTELFIQASGYSMLHKQNVELSIPPGSLVGLARVKSGNLQWGEVYALSTVDGIIIKRVFKGETPEHIKCVSYNVDEYPEFDIQRSEVFDVARITCVIPIHLR